MSRRIDTYILPAAKAAAIKLFLPVVEDGSDPIISKSFLGTPVFSNLIFNASEDTPENEDLIIDTIILTVNQVKNIIKTPINNRPGTVKEYISDGDFQIDARGIIVSRENLVIPKEDVTALVNLMKVSKQLDVASNFLQLFSISSIVITDYRIAEKTGSRNEIPFKFTALSDEPIELQLDPVISNVNP